MKYYIYILFSVVLLVSCKGQKQVAESRYATKPLVQVEQEQLDKEALLVSAKAQQLVGSTSEAMAQYAAILKRDPGYAPANYEMSQLLMRMGMMDSALACVKRAVKADGSNVWYLKQQAAVYEQMRDGKNLVATWEAIVRRNPEVMEYYYELSDANLKTNNIPAAVEVLNRVEKKIGVSEMISLQKQRLWDAYGKPEKAMKEIETLAAAMPQETKYSAILAESYMKQQQYAKAKVCYDRILAADPNDEYVHISLASYYKAVGDMDNAYEELKKGFSHPAIDATSKLQILGSFYSNDEFYGVESKHTFPLLDQIMAQCEDKSTYALFYGDVLMRQQKYAEAAVQLRLALTKDSSQYEVWEALLICLSETNEEDVMLDYARRAQTLFPLHALPYYLQGFSCMQHKQYAEGKELLRRCEKLGFPHGYLEFETYGLLADCLYHTGETELAFGYYDKCLELRADEPGVLNNYAYYLAQAGVRLERACEMAAKAVKSAPENATFLDTYAWVLHKMGRDKEALPVIQKAVKLDPKSETLNNHLKEIAAAL